MSVRMLYLPPAIADSCDEVGRILLAKYIERFFESVLFDQAMSSKIPARRISCDQILFGQEALRASIIAGREMDLGEPECIFVIFCED